MSNYKNNKNISIFNRYNDIKKEVFNSIKEYSKKYIMYMHVLSQYIGIFGIIISIIADMLFNDKHWIAYYTYSFILYIQTPLTILLIHTFVKSSWKKEEWYLGITEIVTFAAFGQSIYLQSCEQLINLKFNILSWNCIKWIIYTCSSIIIIKTNLKNISRSKYAQYDSYTLYFVTIGFWILHIISMPLLHLIMGDNYINIHTQYELNRYMRIVVGITTIATGTSAFLVTLQRKGSLKNTANILMDVWVIHGIFWSLLTMYWFNKPSVLIIIIITLYGYVLTIPSTWKLTLNGELKHFINTVNP